MYQSVGSLSYKTREDIKSVLEVETVTSESKYLGLPTLEGRMKDESFQLIMDKLGKRCNNWTERFMSYAAKEGDWVFSHARDMYSLRSEI